MARSLSLIGQPTVSVRQEGSEAVLACQWIAGRSRRVTLLVLATATLGLLDLAFTLTYMQTIGMVELNPLARFMIGIGGAGQLVRFKLFTIVLSGGLLFLIRRKRGAEWCAWISLVTLILLSLHWVRYIQSTEEMGATLLAETSIIDHRWIAITE